MRKRWFCGASRPMLKFHSVPPVCECLRVSGTGSGMGLFWAGVAQLVEHLICNQTVGGSSPFASSNYAGKAGRKQGLPGRIGAKIPRQRREIEPDGRSGMRETGRNKAVGRV